MSIINIIKEDGTKDSVDASNIRTKIYNSINSSKNEILDLTKNIIYYAGIEPRSPASSDSLTINQGFNPLITYKKYNAVNNILMSGKCEDKFIKGFPIDDKSTSFIHIAIFNNCCAYYFEYKTEQQGFNINGRLDDPGMIISEDYDYLSCDILPNSFNEHIDRIEDSRLYGHIFKIPLTVAINILEVEESLRANIFNEWFKTVPKPIIKNVSPG